MARKISKAIRRLTDNPVLIWRPGSRSAKRKKRLSYWKSCSCFDLTLKFQGESTSPRIFVHKFILAAHSSVFRDLFSLTADGSQSSPLRLPSNMSPGDCFAVLNSIYSGTAPRRDLNPGQAEIIDFFDISFDDPDD